MKRMALIFVVIFNSFFIFSDDYKSLFDKAVGFYENKKYNEALKIFLELKEYGFDNFNVNYNVGSTYFKLKKYGYSRYYFERALFFKPFDKELFNNLKIVYGKILKDEVYGEQEIMNKRIIFFIPLKLLLIFFVVFFLASLVFLFLLLNSYKKSFLVLFIVAFFFSGIFTTLFLIQYFDYNRKIFVTSQNNVSVLIAPAKDETAISILNEGSKGVIIEATKDFFKINLPDGTSGWIDKKKTVSNFF
ncbi:MAG TPA: hypothetical protein PLO89_02370 [Spirochaetota bacterium]|nr:hypothetical protein [Spirochaetota bacterium]